MNQSPSSLSTVRFTLLPFILLFFSISIFGQPNDIALLLEKGDDQVETNPKEALAIYNQAIEIIGPETSKSQIADVHSKTGNAYYLLGYYPQAIGEFKTALTFYQEAGKDSMAAEVLAYIGSSYYFGEIKGNEAEQYFTQAYEAFKKLGYVAQAQFNANYLGYIHWANGDKEGALKIHQECLSVFDSLDNLKGRATSCSDIGFTLNSLGRYSEALDYNLTALELAKKLENRRMIIPILNNIGISYLHLNQLKKAEKYSQLSLSAAKERSLNLRVKEALATLHDIYARMGNYELAYAIHIQLKDISDSIKNVEQVRKLTQRDEQAAFELKKQQLKAIQAEKDAITQAEISKEKDRNIALIIGLVMLLLIASLLIVNIKSRARHAALLKTKNAQLEDSNILISKQNTKLVEHQKALEEKNDELEDLLQELKRAQSKLIQYEKLASLGVLTTGIAHEINNPLNFIKSGIYALEDIISTIPDNENKALGTSILEHINTGMERIKYVVGELNRFSKNSISKELVPCHIKQILENCLMILKPKIEETKCTINLHFSPDDIVIQAHEGSLHQIFSNIIENAILSLKEQGVIDISAKLASPDQLEVTVKDNGSGMSPEVLNHAFDPFFTTRQPGEGVGLGLYVSYKLIGSHKGTINLSSTENVGTICTIILPVN